MQILVAIGYFDWCLCEIPGINQKGIMVFTKIWYCKDVKQNHIVAFVWLFY